MDFDLPEEIRILRDTVRKFVDKELIPLERLYRHDSEGPMPEHLLKPLQETAKAIGLWMLDVPPSTAVLGSVCCRAVSSMKRLRGLLPSHFAASSCLVQRFARFSFTVMKSRKKDFSNRFCAASCGFVSRRPSPMPGAIRRICAPARCRTAIISSSTAPNVSSRPRGAPTTLS